MEFYRRLADLTRYTFSARAMWRRYRANDGATWQLANLLRGVSAQGRGRARLYEGILHRLETDRAHRDFFEGETTELPEYYVNRVREDLGPMWEWLPEGALTHDHLAALAAKEEAAPAPGSSAGENGERLEQRRASSDR